jgi:Integrase core domain
MERKIVENLRSGKGVNSICKVLKVGKKRVAQIRKKALEYGYLDKDKQLPPYPEALFPVPDDGRSHKTSAADLELIKQKEWIIARLEAGWQPVTVHEEIQINVSKASFYRFIHRHGLIHTGENSRKKVISEIIYSPGDALLVDWGKLRDVLYPETGEKKTLWAFVGIMGHSRYMLVRLVWTHDVSTTLGVLEDILKELGGVPSRIISDNPKCFSLEASKYEPLLNPAYERFASHYSLQIECLPPATPQLKGKVERMMPFVRRLYQAHKDNWHGIEESQIYINQKVAIANERLHGTTGKKPIDLFVSEETVALKSLPALAYEVEQFHEGKVRQDGHVRFDNKYYSLEEKYIGEEVVIIGNSKQVSLYHQGKLIEVHERLTDHRRSKSTKDAHKTPWERELEDESFYRKRAAKVGQYVEEVVVNLLIQGNGFIDTRKIWGILSLDKKYSNEQINDACKKAVELDSYGYRAVLSLLEIYHPKSLEPAKEIKNGSSKFLRPIGEYQELLNLPKGENFNEY